MRKVKYGLGFSMKWLVLVIILICASVLVWLVIVNGAKDRGVGLVAGESDRQVELSEDDSSEPGESLSEVIWQYDPSSDDDTYLVEQRQLAPEVTRADLDQLRPEFDLRQDSNKQDDLRRESDEVLIVESVLGKIERCLEESEAECLYLLMSEVVQEEYGLGAFEEAFALQGGLRMLRRGAVVIDEEWAFQDYGFNEVEALTVVLKQESGQWVLYGTIAL